MLDFLSLYFLPIISTITIFNSQLLMHLEIKVKVTNVFHLLNQSTSCYIKSNTKHYKIQNLNNTKTIIIYIYPYSKPTHFSDSNFLLSNKIYLQFFQSLLLRWNNDVQQKTVKLLMILYRVISYLFSKHTILVSSKWNVASWCSNKIAKVDWNPFGSLWSSKTTWYVVRLYFHEYQQF